MKPDFLLNHAMAEITYSLTVLPCTTLLYLSNRPSSKPKAFLRYIKYIIIYSLVEALLHITGRIVYEDGWSIWHSVFFYFLMFIAITVHNKKPIIAYIVFISITIFSIWYFKLPIK